MKKRTLLLVVLLIFLLGLVGCKQKSTFSIKFIDVGQGDSALVECDGHYMLIDGGDVNDAVYNELVARGVQHLDILAISHMHEDHIGGLEKALRYASKIDLAISNTNTANTETFQKLNSVLSTNGVTITVPKEDDEKKYNLGSAIVEVVANSNLKHNDSLVLLITYKKTKFLFTGDIEGEEQKRITQKYGGYEGKEYKVDLVKMPHHGAYPNKGELRQFIYTFMPDYAIISVGAHNQYGHPDWETIDILGEKGLDAQVYRTDKNGDITVLSDGKKVTVKPQKQ